VREPPESKVERERVRTRIGGAIKQFGLSVFSRDVHADEIRHYVTTHVGPVAPGSADRILRDLRQRGEIDYVLVSRRKSLYRFVRVGEVMAGVTGQLPLG
jgi:hypothetical protein